MAGLHERQVAALCWRKRKGLREVLLITSRETRRWVIPKGWPMDCVKDFNAARTEAYEEAGVTGRVSRTPLGSYAYDKVRKTESTRVTVTVYSLEVRCVLKHWPERLERRREWFGVAEAAKRVNEAGLKAIILGLGLN